MHLLRDFGVQQLGPADELAQLHLICSIAAAPVEEHARDLAPQAVNARAQGLTQQLPALHRLRAPGSSPATRGRNRRHERVCTNSGVPSIDATDADGDPPGGVASPSSA